MTKFSLCAVLMLTKYSLAAESKVTEPVCPSNSGIPNSILEKFVDIASSVVTLQENFDMKMAELQFKEVNLEMERSAFKESLTVLADEVKNNITQKMAEFDSTINNKLNSLAEQVNTFIDTSNARVQSMMIEIQAKGNASVGELEAVKDKMEKGTEIIENKLSKDMNASFALLRDRLEDEMLTEFTAIQERFDFFRQEVLTLANTSMTEVERYAKGHLKPNVAFLARDLPSSNPGRFRRLIFQSTEVNTLNTYNTKTGQFTAPIEGTYWFATQICGVYDSYVSFRIYVNRKMMSDSSNRNTDYGICTTSSTVAILKTGDTVHVETGGNTRRWDKSIYRGSDRWNMFMGALVN